MNPRVTFGMIVLNGEPFVRYNLRALYRFATRCSRWKTERPLPQR